jgi:hypothetical protein
MSEDFEPSADRSDSIKPVSHGRILWLMAVMGLVGGVAGAALGSLRFGLGFMVGVGLSLANYFWLKSSLRKIFAAAEAGERPRMLAVKYFLRYLILAVVIAIIYAAELLPIVAVILGLGSFGFAVVIEGLIRSFSKP